MLCQLMMQWESKASLHTLNSKHNRRIAKLCDTIVEKIIYYVYYYYIIDHLQFTITFKQKTKTRYNNPTERKHNLKFHCFKIIKLISNVLIVIVIVFWCLVMFLLWLILKKMFSVVYQVKILNKKNLFCLPSIQKIIRPPLREI